MPIVTRVLLEFSELISSSYAHKPMALALLTLKCVDLTQHVDTSPFLITFYQLKLAQLLAHALACTNDTMT